MKQMVIPAAWLRKIIESSDDSVRVGNFIIEWDCRSMQSEAWYCHVSNLSGERIGKLRVASHWPKILTDGQPIKGAVKQYRAHLNTSAFHGLVKCGNTMYNCTTVDIDSKRRVVYHGRIGVITFFKN